MRLINADEMIERLPVEVGGKENREFIKQLINKMPTRWEETDGSYIPCDHGDYFCRNCKYHHIELGCQRKGGRTYHLPEGFYDT